MLNNQVLHIMQCGAITQCTCEFPQAGCLQGVKTSSSSVVVKSPKCSSHVCASLSGFRWRHNRIKSLLLSLLDCSYFIGKVCDSKHLITNSVWKCSRENVVKLIFMWIPERVSWVEFQCKYVVGETWVRQGRFMFVHATQELINILTPQVLLFKIHV